MVRLLVAHRIVRQVGKDDIGLTAHQFHQLRADGRIGEIGFQQIGARHRIDRQQIDTDNMRRALLDRHLHPTARRTAEIDDPRPLVQQLETFVDLDQLESRPRPPPFCLGLLDVGVVQLPFQPFGG